LVRVPTQITWSEGHGSLQAEVEIVPWDLTWECERFAIEAGQKHSSEPVGGRRFESFTADRF
jgi:hypothetical protein